MQDNIPDALITAFERQYDSSWNDPKLRKERLAMRYGWAAAMEAKPCLHQIQEPAPVQTNEVTPIVVPDDMPSTDANTKYGESYGVDWVYAGKKPGPVLAAPAAVAVPDERAAFEDFMRRDTSGFTLERHEDGSYKEFEVATYWHFWQARAALAATPAADAQVPKGTYVSISGELKPDVSVYSTPVAAPVVLPEPDAAVMEVMRLVDELRILSIGHGQRFSGISTASDQAFDESANMLTHQSSAIESKLRALLAGVSAPAAQCNSKLLNAARTLNALRAEYQRETDEVHPGNEHWSQRFSNGYAALMDAVIDVQLTSAAPQAQADARDAEQERWMGIGKAIERACVDLPAGAEINIHLEKDAGTVTLSDCDGDEQENFPTDEGFAGVVNAAIDAAIAAAKGEK